MSHAARSPKDLRQMVSDANSDTESTQNTLDKLKELSEDDKSENVKLRSRIDEQCQLIMILKQRADEGTIRVLALEKINKQLVEFKDQAEGMLKTELSKYNLLDGRFSSLASNHEEMIRIKDEYKRVNQQLREENAQLREDNIRLFSSTIAEKDNLITELDKKCLLLQEQCSSLEQKFKTSQVEWHRKEDALRQNVSELEAISLQQTKDFLKRLNETEESLKEAEKKLKTDLESREGEKEAANGKLLQLNKEKEELLALVMQRGKLVEKAQNENKVLKKKTEELEDVVRNLEKKFVLEAEAVNTNLRVKRLTDELEVADHKYSQLIKEFEAFKKHSSDLLKREKELNEKLRQLYA